MTDYIETATDGPVRIIRLCGSPSRGNPLSGPLWQRLLAAVHEAEADDAIACMVLLGTDRFFSVGADISEIVDRKAIECALEKWMDDWDTLRASAKPIIAGVSGIAFGGGLELALLADLMVCAEDARLALPETSIGVIPGAGGGQRLIALCGRAVAADMILTGRELSGREACDRGIAARAVPAAEVEETCIAMAKGIAERSPTALLFAREVLRETTDGPIRQSLRIERLLAYLVFDTEDRQQRMQQFLEQRKKR